MSRNHALWMVVSLCSLFDLARSSEVETAFQAQGAVVYVLLYIGVVWKSRMN
jgi:hypothetical protein